DVQSADELGTLDPAAIARVKEEAWPEARSADELHDALLVAGCIPELEAMGAMGAMGATAPWKEHFDQLVAQGRAGRLLRNPVLWIAAERKPLFEVLFPDAETERPMVTPERERGKTWSHEDAAREIVRGRLEAVGPTTASDISRALGLPQDDV